MTSEQDPADRTVAARAAGGYDRDRDSRPGHVTRLSATRADGAWGSCSCGWLTPVGLLMGEASSAIEGHLAEADGQALR